MTAYEMRISDWSSDVCSSDLAGGVSLYGGRSCHVLQRRCVQEGRFKAGGAAARLERAAGSIGYAGQQWFAQLSADVGSTGVDQSGKPGGGQQSAVCDQ